MPSPEEPSEDLLPPLVDPPGRAVVAQMITRFLSEAPVLTDEQVDERYVNLLVTCVLIELVGRESENLTLARKIELARAAGAAQQEVTKQASMPTWKIEGGLRFLTGERGLADEIASEDLFEGAIFAGLYLLRRRVPDAKRDQALMEAAITRFYADATVSAARGRGA